MTRAEEIDVETVTPSEFARIIAEHKDKELRSLLRELGFARITDRVFTIIPEHYRGGTDSEVLQFRIHDDDEVQEHALVLEGPDCRHERGRVDGARATVMADAVSLCKLVTGQANEAALLLRGRLKVKGDLLWARGVLQRFDVPQP